MSVHLPNYGKCDCGKTLRLVWHGWNRVYECKGCGLVMKVDGDIK
jgi:hypothetical protein